MMISIVGLNLGVISMLIEFILVAKYNFYIAKKLLWKFIYKEKVSFHVNTLACVFNIKIYYSTIETTTMYHIYI